MLEHVNKSKPNERAKSAVFLLLSFFFFFFISQFYLLELTKLLESYNIYFNLFINGIIVPLVPGICHNYKSLSIV
jgi:Ca2+/H+ antiporter